MKAFILSLLLTLGLSTAIAQEESSRPVVCWPAKELQKVLTDENFKTVMAIPTPYGTMFAVKNDKGFQAILEYVAQANALCLFAEGKAPVQANAN